MIASDIIIRINSVKRAVRVLFLISGISYLIIFIALFSIATFIIDISIPDLPRGVRIIFLLMGFVVLVYVLLKYLFYPLRKPITDDDVVVCVEKNNPELKERLISSVQLSRSMTQRDSFSSPELVKILISQTNKAAKQLDFKNIIDTKTIKKIVFFMIGLILLIGVYSSFNPSYAGIWFNRILGGGAKWPKKTFLRVVVKNDVVAKGSIAISSFGPLPLPIFSPI